MRLGGAPATGRWIRAAAIGMAIALIVAMPGGASGSPMPSSAAASGADSIIATYRARIPALMAKEGLPGLAIALVDGDRVVWTEGFGHLDREGSGPVTVDTMFGVQSMSKTFTATAVMRAVQAGLVDLDAPITTYLPEFTVHSAFEAHAERKITLRMLLSHTAGFTHEAPIGNNFELDPGDFDAHVRSISDTWLRFPVGTGYAYSNLGIDLAGAILERAYRAPFSVVMRDSVLAPIGMTHSTFDRAEIQAASDRAIGHTSPSPAVPLDVSMTAAGGLYASATDLARFLRFQLAGGTIDGQDVLDPALVGQMRTVPAPNAGSPVGYALGVERDQWHAGGEADLFFHGGGGFGFLSDLWWAPQLQVGIAVLTNSTDHHLQGDLALSILRDLVHQPGSVEEQRLLALPDVVPAFELDAAFALPDDLAGLVDDAAMPASAGDPARWAGYAGSYRAESWGVILPAGPSAQFVVASGAPWFVTPESGTPDRLRLSEIEPGLFLAENGETLDLRGVPPTWRNIELVRACRRPLARAVGRARRGGDHRARVARLAAVSAARGRRRPRDAGGGSPFGVRGRPAHCRSRDAHSGPGFGDDRADRSDARAGRFGLHRLARPATSTAPGAPSPARGGSADRLPGCSRCGWLVSALVASLRPGAVCGPHGGLGPRGHPDCRVAADRLRPRVTLPEREPDADRNCRSRTTLAGVCPCQV